MTKRISIFTSCFLQMLVRGFSLFRPLLGGQVCRFHPSCTQYALQSLQKHGAAKGSWLAAKRLAKCHPFNPGGWDPVP
ncbi:MAG: membrane protein insertion efficiency factor YidD [Elusimicrobiaceae bacterium]